MQRLSLQILRIESSVTSSGNPWPCLCLHSVINLRRSLLEFLRSGVSSTGSNGTRLPIHTRGLCTHNSFLSSCVVAQGPSVTTIADPLVEWVERYTQQLGFEFSDEREMPYLFYCSGSTSRNVSSSQWTTMVHFGSSLPAFQPCSLVALLLQVKDAFAKFSPGNIGVPPKLLR